MNNLVVDVISDASIVVLWDPPSRPNGIFTHYDVIMFNELSGFNFSTAIPAWDDHEVIVTGLSKKDKYKMMCLG